MTKNELKEWMVEEIPLFDQLPFDEKVYIHDVLTHKTYKKNTFLFLDGDNVDKVFFILKGRVKIFKSSHLSKEKESIKKILYPGDSVGIYAIIDSQEYCIYWNSGMIMDNNTEILSIPLEEFERIAIKFPYIFRQVTKTLFKDYLNLAHRLETFSLLNARERVIDFIKEMAEEKGQKIGYETLVKHNLTHQEIAHITGISRQKVTTILNKLKQENAINIERNSILIRDIDKLV